MPSTTLSVHHVAIDVGARSVTRDGVPVALEPVEWQLLETLILADGAPVQRQELLAQIFGAAFVHDDAYLMVAVWRLRKKIEADPSKPALIKMTREGYRLDPCGQAPCACLSAPLGFREGDLVESPPKRGSGVEGMTP
jgi:DNA-binding response OmpR family regulator